MYSSDDDNILELIHIKLDVYVDEFITTNKYQLWAQAAVSELVQSLKPVAMVDPNALSLEKSPFQVLLRRLSLDSLTPYRDLPHTVNPETQIYLKDTIKFLSAKEKSGTGWEDTETDEHAHIWLDAWIATPLISRRARNTTPQFGMKKTLPQPIHLDPVQVEEIQEQALNAGGLLNLSLCISEPDLLKSVSSLLKTTGTLSRPSTNYKSRTQRWLEIDSEDPVISRYDMLTPIFSRAHRAGSGNLRRRKSLQRFSELSLSPVKNPESDGIGNMYKSNMVVVGGWTTIQTSSPVPSSTSSEVDELFDIPEISSPRTELSPIKLLREGKDSISIPAFPRSKRNPLRSSQSGPPRLTKSTSFSTFLLPLITAIPRSPIKIIENLESVSNIPEGSYMDLSACTDEIMDKFSSLYSLPNLTHDTSLTTGLQERIDNDGIKENVPPEKEGMLLADFMDVPLLPSPNSHASTLPSSLKEYLVQSSIVDTNQAINSFLKKTKGIKHLNTSLNWTPFPSFEKFLTKEEVMQVLCLQKATDSTDLSVHELLMTMKAAILQDDQQDVERQLDQIHCESEQEGIPETFCSGSSNIILSRAERHRLKGISSLPPLNSLGKYAEDEDDVSSSDKENIPSDPRKRYLPYDDLSEPHSKRPCIDSEFVPWSILDDSAINLELDFHRNTHTPPPSPDRFSFYPEEPHDEFGIHEDHPTQNALAYSEEPFVALSFDSQSQKSTSTPVPPILSSGETCMNGQDDVAPISVREEHTHHLDPSPPTGDSNPIVPTDESDFLPSLHLASHSLGISNFAKLRAKKIPDEPPSKPAEPLEIEDAVLDVPMPREIPLDIFDENTLRLSDEELKAPVSRNRHWYLISLATLQKRILMLALNTRTVELVEREDLSGCDIIIDAHTAVVCPNLLSLPAHCDDLGKLLTFLSWKFDRVLVAFEAFQPSLSFKLAPSTQIRLFAYTPPVVKALRKLRRALTISKAVNQRNTRCDIQLAFASNVEELASYIRHYGDLAESRDQQPSGSGGAVWGERVWLEDENPEDEDYLTNADGMNRFAARVILCQVTLDDFFEYTAEERMKQFAYLVGSDRIKCLNMLIQQQKHELPSSDVSKLLDEYQYN